MPASHSGTMQANDSDLILRARAGDGVAFEQLVQRYDRRVLTIAASYVNSSDDAKDIYQEVFLRVYRGLKKFELRSEFSTWLYRITTNVCLSHRTRGRKHHHTSLDRDVDEEDGQGNTLHESLGSAGAADDRTVSGDIARQVDESLKSLSPRQRMVFTLRHYEGFKLREIAGMMHLTEGSVKKYLFEATARMRARLRHFSETEH